MKNAAHYRALASLCRQKAAYSPMQSWCLLGQAQRSEHLAEDALASHFKECNGPTSDEGTGLSFSSLGEVTAHRNPSA